MPRLRSESELEALRAKAVALDQKIREVAARTKAKREEEDHRRCLLAGRAALEHMEAEPECAFAATLLKLINANVRAVADRSLFGLAPLPKETEAVTVS
jgi:hypothetical protein